VSEFRKAYLGELPQQMQANLVTLENLHSQLRLNNDNQSRAAERRDSLTALLAEAASSPQTFVASAGGPSLAESHAARLARLRQELAGARARFTEQHPTVVRLKAQLASTESEPSSSPGDATATAVPSSPYVLRMRETLSATESELKVLKTEEQRLRGGIAAYQLRLENTPKREQEFQELSRDYESTKQLYDSLGKRHEEAQLAESMEQRQKGERFRILDPAVPSQIPAAPNRVRLFIVSLVLSLGLGIGALVVAEMLDTSFHSVNELRDFSSVPIFVSIPKIVTEVDRQRQQRRFRLAAAGTVLGLVLIAGVSYFIGHGNEQLVQMLGGGGS
jgi:succinoglycan biosynthesis transport protein ExoP